MREVEEDGHILIELLAIPLGCQRTTTKWLVMVTTLLDPVAVSAQSPGALQDALVNYERRRINIERQLTGCQQLGHWPI
jgi:hypothetical protein